MEPSIFTKILEGSIPGVIVHRDDATAVLMDKFPTIEGQTLVVSCKQVDYLFDLDEATHTRMWQAARKTAHAMKQAFPNTRVCLVVEGFEVPHAHIRLYPVPDGTPFITKAGTAVDDVILEEQAQRIRSFL